MRQLRRLGLFVWLMVSGPAALAIVLTLYDDTMQRAAPNHTWTDITFDTTLVLEWQVRRAHVINGK